MEKLQIGIFVGSLRKGSYSKSVARWVEKNAPEALEMRIIEIGHLSLYNQDYDDDSPASYTEFRNLVQTLDGCLFITPEYNRSVPAVLKNALDVASRPWGKNVWDGKPAGVISLSTGNIGGFGASFHLRQSFTFLNLFPMQQPELYISKAQESIDENGNVNSEKLIKLLSTYMSAYAEWIKRFANR